MAAGRERERERKREICYAGSVVAGKIVGGPGA